MTDSTETKSVRPSFEVGDKIMLKQDYHVYEVVKVDHRGVFIWTKMVMVSKIHVYAQTKMEDLVMWHKKPDGSVWTSPYFHSQTFRPREE